MVLKIVTGLDSGPGNRVTLDTGDDAYIDKDAYVWSTNTIAIKGDGSGHAVSVQGTVTAAAGAIWLGDDNSNSGQSLLVGEDALVETTSNSNIVNAVLIEGHGSLVDNRGTIRGVAGALYVTGDTPSDPITILNSGLIEALSEAVSASGSATVDFFNSGVVRTTNVSGLSYSGSSGQDVVTNTGLMSGHISLWKGDDIYDGRGGGHVTGDVFGEDGADKLFGASFAEHFYGGKDADLLDGGGGDDLLDGGAGADFMKGGAGSDQYFVDEAGDVVSEAGGAGNDVVNSSIGFSLANPTHAIGAVERLTLTGTAAVNGIGNSLANSITGNDAANTLSGAVGNDTLIGNAGDDTLLGGAGNDRLLGDAGSDTLIGGVGRDTLTGGADNDFFVFNAPLSAANRDVITDFSNLAGNNDTFRLENAVMTKLGPAGALNAAFFHAGAAAHDANDHIIYNKATGALFYDADGTGAHAAIQFATLTNHATLSAHDFAVI
jgi:Ca2+-binding RTX toxin-like protein